MEIPMSFASACAIQDDFEDFHVTGINFVVRRKADAGWTIRDIVYPSMHTIVWAASGRAHYSTPGTGFDVHAGQMLFFPAGVRRSARSDRARPWRFDSIGFTLAPTADPTTTAARLAALPYAVKPPAEADVSAAVEELDRQWHEHLPGSNLRCRGIVSRLLGLYVQAASQQCHSGARRPALDGIIELLRSNPKRLYSIEELAGQARLSPSRFRVLFRQATGTSALRFQNGVRIRRAAGLLRSGEHSVTEVADMLGYADLFYFSRQFKQFTGLPPSSYLTR